MQTDIASQLAGWGKRDPDIAASRWTPEQRQMFESAARLFQAQAQQLVALARQTPHRVMRELYEQRIAYTRAYANTIPAYIPEDDRIALVATSLGATATNICTAIRNFSAANRAPSVPAAHQPTAISPIGDPANPQRFLNDASDACPRVRSVAERESLELAAWYKTDPNVPASQRSPEDQILSQMAAKVLTRGADELDRIGRASGNSILEDFLTLSGQYYRAFVDALPTSTSADESLYDAAQRARITVYSACEAAQV